MKLDTHKNQETKTDENATVNEENKDMLGQNKHNNEETRIGETAAASKEDMNDKPATHNNQESKIVENGTVEEDVKLDKPSKNTRKSQEIKTVGNATVKKEGRKDKPAKRKKQETKMGETASAVNKGRMGQETNQVDTAPTERIDKDAEDKPVKNTPQDMEAKIAMAENGPQQNKQATKSRRRPMDKEDMDTKQDDVVDTTCNKQAEKVPLEGNMMVEPPKKSRRTSVDAKQGQQDTTVDQAASRKRAGRKSVEKKEVTGKKEVEAKVDGVNTPKDHATEEAKHTPKAAETTENVDSPTRNVRRKTAAKREAATNGKAGPEQPDEKRRVWESTSAQRIRM